PGFITDALPFALLSMERRVDAVEIEEFANLSRRNSPNLLFELMGFGQPLASFDAARSSYLLAEFEPPLAALAEAAALPVEEWTCTGEVAAARRDTSILAGELAAGSIAAQRTTIVGRSDGADGGPPERLTRSFRARPPGSPRIRGGVTKRLWVLTSVLDRQPMESKHSRCQ